MATIDKYVIDVEVQGQNNIDKLKTGINGLGTALAGLGIAAFVHGFLQLADSISDLSDATGLAIGKIAAFQEALMLAGGKAENAGKMLATFYQSIDKASQGSEQAQKALERVGISFADLGKLSEEALLDKALKALSDMPAGAERTAAAIEVFGKSIRSIDPAKLNELLQSGDFAKIQEEIKKAGDMADKLAANMHTMQMAGISAFGAITSALEPFIGKVEEGRLKLEQAEKIVYGVGIAFAVVFGSKVIMTVVELTQALIKFNTVLATTETISMLLGKNPLWKILAGVAVTLGIGAAAWNEYEKAVKAAKETEEKTPEQAASTEPTGPARKTQLYSDEEEKARRIALTTAEQTTLQLEKQNDEAAKYQRLINDTIGIEQRSAAYRKIDAQIDKDTKDKILDLTKQIEIEKSKGRGTNQGVIAEYEKQKIAVEAQAETMKKLKKEEYDRTVLANIQLATEQGRVSLLEQQLKNSQDLTALKFKEKVISGEMTQEQATRAEELYRIEQNGLDRIQILQQQYNDAKRIGDEAAMQRIKDLIILEELRYKQGVDLAVKKQKQEDNMRESATAGAVAALAQIEQANKPFKLAQDMTTQLFNNLSQAIDRFVTTGKFSFGDLARSWAQTILKMELNYQASLLWKAMGGGASGGIFGTIASWLFKAEGGPVNAQRPYIVGEKGPELFVPGSSGTIVPSNQLMGGGQRSTVVNNNYNYNINAVDAKSVAQLFAENRKTLLGTVQMAQKELPYSNI